MLHRKAPSWSSAMNSYSFERPKPMLQKLDGQLTLDTCSLMHWGNRNSASRGIALIAERGQVSEANLYFTLRNSWKVPKHRTTFLAICVVSSLAVHVDSFSVVARFLRRNSWIYLVQTFIPFVSLLNNFIRSNRIKSPSGRQLQQVELVTVRPFLLQIAQFCVPHREHYNNLFLCAALRTVLKDCANGPRDLSIPVSLPPLLPLIKIWFMPRARKVRAADL